MGVVPQCVLCHARPVDTRWRPFCSERCRNVDLAKWVDGAYSVASNSLERDAVAETDDSLTDTD